ncbi:hypothetical protein F4811DRAFT_535398 [Daldinia bambusicola]|nr:hypothetical protein F4811DRAFT_535398 [Daldinia bambusicola]
MFYKSSLFVLLGLSGAALSRVIGDRSSNPNIARDDPGSPVAIIANAEVLDEREEPGSPVAIIANADVVEERGQPGSPVAIIANADIVDEAGK